MSRQISGVLTPQDKEAIMAAVADIRKRMPFMLALSTKDKQGLPKMGDRSRAFVQKAMEVATQHPDHLPGTFDLEEMRRDIELFETIYPVAMALSQLQSEVNDTLTAVGSDAYSAALKVYRYTKAHGEGTGLDALVDDMGRRFGRRTRRTSPAEKKAP